MPAESIRVWAGLLKWITGTELLLQMFVPVIGLFFSFYSMLKNVNEYLYRYAITPKDGRARGGNGPI